MPDTSPNNVFACYVQISDSRLFSRHEIIYIIEAAPRVSSLINGLSVNASNTKKILRLLGTCSLLIQYQTTERWEAFFRSFHIE